MNGSEIARCSIIWLMRMHCCAIRRILRSPTSVITRGDHLHPNQAGGMLLAQAYDLQKLTGEA